MCTIFTGLFADKLLAGEPAAEEPAIPAGDVTTVLANIGDLEDPAIPLDYADWTILCTGSDRLLIWMHQNDVPEPAKWLFNIICFFNIYRYEAARNGGKVTHEMNETAKVYLIEGLQHMQALGERW